MAQLLVFNRDNVHPDPVKDRQGCYKTGDIVGVFPDSHVFGTLETLPTFRVVQAVGSVSDYEYAISEDNMLRLPKSALKMPAQRRAAIRNTVPEPIRRRRYQYTTKIEQKNA